MQNNLTDFDSHSNAITALREQVFVIEQHVPRHLEQDGLDSQCQHAVIFMEGELVATGRLTPDGHLGRIAVAKPFRGSGLGIKVVKALEHAAHAAGMKNVELAAQISALPFYEQLGYQQFGEVFMEAGIEHINMNKVLS